jgi:hypothetical protein
MAKGIIMIKDNKIYLTPNDYFSLEQTNLSNAQLGFSKKKDIYFEIEFEKENRKLIVRIMNYKSEEKSRFDRQQVKSEISFIEFTNLDREQIDEFIVSGYLDKLPLKKDAPKITRLENKFNPLKEEIIRKPYIRSNFISQVFPKKVMDLSPRTKTREEKFDFPFKDADFNLGFVSFHKKFIWHEEPIHFRIENAYIRNEFDHIKNYFPKVFNGKSNFKVNACITFEDDVIKKVEAKSIEIEQINETVIDNIKVNRINNLSSVPSFHRIDKSLFTADEIFSNFVENENNVFSQSEKDIVDSILDYKKNIRNKKQLLYLSAERQSLKNKIRFTLKPFGFVFLIEGESMFHYCWELLDTHATYLWSFRKDENDLLLQYNRIEKTINTIRNNGGRIKYKKSYRTKEIDTDLLFYHIEHKKENSDSNDDFLEWVQKLKEKLI